MKLQLSRALITAGLFTCGAAFAAPSADELWETIQKQQAEIDALKKEQKATQDELKLTDKKVEATVDAIEGASSTSGANTGKLSEWASKTRIGGYGEHHYNNFENGNDKVDAHRYVLYFAHDFNESVKFFSEFELEHSLAGEGKPGEVELEQAYIEWGFANNHSLITGQFLVPVGILNETHEPDTFYGVERNKIESDIVPSTWWETGLMLQGEIAPGFRYDLAVHSGLAADDGATVRGGRQKSANAIANDLAYTARLKYTGLAGLELAASVQVQEDITQGAAPDASAATLMALHAIYQIANFSVRALYANWDIDGAGFDATGRDTQQGWFVEPSYKFTDKFGAFLRFSRWDNSAGLANAEANDVTDIGFNFWLHERVVFKADYQDAGDYNDNSSFNLGVGWSY